MASRHGRVPLVLAVLAAVGCVSSWLAAQRVVEVAPVIDGEPTTTSVVFYPPWLVVAFLLAAIAGVLAVFGFAHLRRGRQHGRGPSTGFVS